LHKQNLDAKQKLNKTMKLLYNGIVRLCWNKNVKEFFNYDKDGNIGEIEDGFGGAGTKVL